jgi:hypothetical protein
LVVRLASQLWRLRRAVAIETGLFQALGQILRDRHFIDGHDDTNDPLKVFYNLLRHPRRASASNDATSDQTQPSQRAPRNVDPIEMAVCFLRLENFNPDKIELIGLHETRSWRQLAQKILTIESMRPATAFNGRRRNMRLLRGIERSRFPRWPNSHDSR